MSAIGFDRRSFPRVVFYRIGEERNAVRPWCSHSGRGERILVWRNSSQKAKSEIRRPAALIFSLLYACTRRRRQRLHYRHRNLFCIYIYIYIDGRARIISFSDSAARQEQEAQVRCDRARRRIRERADVLRSGLAAPPHHSKHKGHRKN